MGNHDGAPLASSDNNVVRRVSNDYMAAVHTEVYQPEGKWKPNQDIPRPEGIKELAVNGRKDVYPSWFDQKAGQSTEKLTFDTVSKKKATNCTPQQARTELEIVKTTDPISKKPAYIAPDGYDASKEDDLHKCDDVKPSVSITTAEPEGNSNQVQITAYITQGSHQVTSLKIQAGSTVAADVAVGGTGTYTTTVPLNSAQTITATVTDKALYSGTGSYQFTPKKTTPQSSSGNGSASGNSARSILDRLRQ